MADSPLNGLSFGNLGPAKVVSFTEGKLKQLGADFGKRAGDMGTLADRTGAIDIASPAFGVLGMGLHSAHDQARDNAAEALKAGKAAIESWNKALADSDEAYKEADKKSTVRTEVPLGGGLPGGGLPGGGLPGGGLPGGGLPGAGDLGGLPGGGVPNAGDLGGLDTPGTGGLPDPTLPGADGTGPKLPDPSGTDPKLPDPNALDPSAMNPKLTDPSALDPRTASALDPNGVTGDLGKQNLGLPDPTKTALSGYNPGDLTAGQSRLPGPTTWTGDGQGPGISTNGAYAGGTAGGSLSGGALRGAGAGAMGAGGMPMMPMVPPSGGAGEQGKERDKMAGRGEDEGVWVGDEDIAPPVIGMET